MKKKRGRRRGRRRRRRVKGGGGEDGELERGRRGRNRTDDVVRLQPNQTNAKPSQLRLTGSHQEPCGTTIACHPWCQGAHH